MKRVAEVITGNGSGRRTALIGYKDICVLSGETWSRRLEISYNCLGSKESQADKQRHQLPMDTLSNRSPSGGAKWSCSEGYRTWSGMGGGIQGEGHSNRIVKHDNRQLRLQYPHRYIQPQKNRPFYASDTYRDQRHAILKGIGTVHSKQKLRRVLSGIRTCYVLILPGFPTIVNNLVPAPRPSIGPDDISSGVVNGTVHPRCWRVRHRVHSSNPQQILHLLVAFSKITRRKSLQSRPVSRAPEYRERPKRQLAERQSFQLEFR